MMLLLNLKKEKVQIQAEMMKETKLKTLVSRRSRLVLPDLHQQLLSGAGFEPVALEKPVALPTSVLLPLLGQHFGHEVGASCDGQAGFHNLGMLATQAERPICRDCPVGMHLLLWHSRHTPLARYAPNNY